MCLVARIYAHLVDATISPCLYAPSLAKHTPHQVEHFHCSLIVLPRLALVLQPSNEQSQRTGLRKAQPPHSPGDTTMHVRSPAGEWSTKAYN